MILSVFGYLLAPLLVIFLWAIVNEGRQSWRDRAARRREKRRRRAREMRRMP
jgi:hypothetical protein